MVGMTLAYMMATSTSITEHEHASAKVIRLVIVLGRTLGAYFPRQGERTSVRGMPPVGAR